MTLISKICIFFFWNAAKNSANLLKLKFLRLDVGQEEQDVHSTE
jgi:hypothetical protein